MSKMDFDPSPIKTMATTFVDTPLTPLPTTSTGSGRGDDPVPVTYFTSTAKNEPSSSTEPFTCGGCGKPIVDRYLLRAIDKYWHEDCLTVSEQDFRCFSRYYMFTCVMFTYAFFV
ncbi:unnamed protein product [Soboliphyme baturini]|uniref:LIM zinc-binding domain-containing protein n=1 Tax=Soboliphyme baturini TaxID=241478 RepID=A0A183JAQ3_9BILA|nr:unnamed protein product [Soboliphyme baturini]